MFGRRRSSASSSNDGEAIEAEVSPGGRDEARLPGVGSVRARRRRKTNAIERAGVYRHDVSQRKASIGEAATRPMRRMRPPQSGQTANGS